MCRCAGLAECGGMQDETVAYHAPMPYRAVRIGVHAGRWSITWVVVAARVALSAGATAVTVRRAQYLRHWFAPMRTASMAIGERRALHGDGPGRGRHRASAPCREHPLRRIVAVRRPRTPADRPRFVQPARRRRSRRRQSELTARSHRGRCHRVLDLRLCAGAPGYAGGRRGQDSGR